jgi:lipopolysaccharide transport system ATP-binding protein
VGQAEVFGRVGALLQIGVGFHPLLTGRENIYLNGAILGMRRTEINRKLDEIVAFSGVEDFLDTPVKRYSSGMQVRLGFAVAVHLDPEILLLDEVLAVGDAGFKKKCLAKIDALSQTGCTILFVGHDTALLSALCERSIWLDRGQLKADGTSAEVVKAYLEATTNPQHSTESSQS